LPRRCWWTCAPGCASKDSDRIFRVTTELARQVGRSGCVGCWTRRRCWTRWPPRTPRPWSARRPAGCCALAHPGWPPGSARGCSPRMTIGAGQAGLRLDDPRARERLVDERTRDRCRALFALRGQPLDQRVRQAAEPLAVVVGQDIKETRQGRFRIAQVTAPDRVISTVDLEARHRHKTAAHGLTATRPTSPSIRIRRSSPRPRPARPPPATPSSRQCCWATWRTANLTSRPRRLPTATPATARAPTSPAWPASASRPGSRPRADRARRALRQDYLPDRPGPGHGHLPGQGHRADHRHLPRRACSVRPRVQRLPFHDAYTTSPKGAAPSASTRTRPTSWPPAPASGSPTG
jgi:hypothetical protein